MIPRLLIVDPDEKNCEALKRIFLKEGYEADCTGNAEAAMKLLEELSYDLVLSELTLPGMDGIEFLKIYQGQRLGQEIIIMTANATLDSALKAIKGGASDYLLKPLMYDEAIQSIRKALQEKPGADPAVISCEPPKNSISPGYLATAVSTRRLPSTASSSGSGAVSHSSCRARSGRRRTTSAGSWWRRRTSGRSWWRT